MFALALAVVIGTGALWLAGLLTAAAVAAVHDREWTVAALLAAFALATLALLLPLASTLALTAL